MREPSLHISKTDLEYILSKYGFSVKECSKIVRFLLKEGSFYQLSARKKLAMHHFKTKALEKKFNTISISPRDKAIKFMNLYNSLRRLKFKYGVKDVKENTKDWTLLKEASFLADRFGQDFSIDPEKAYKIYIETAIDFLTPFSTLKLVTMYELICECYQALLEIESDKNIEVTQKLYDEYYRTIYSKTGITNDYRTRPNKYVYFVRAASIAVERGIDPHDYIVSQFQNLDWINGVPDPSLLIGDKALERLQKYLFSSNKKVNKTLNKVYENIREWRKQEFQKFT